MWLENPATQAKLEEKMAAVRNNAILENVVNIVKPSSDVTRDAIIKMFQVRFNNFF